MILLIPLLFRFLPKDPSSCSKQPTQHNSMAPRKIPAATLESTIENVHLRSGYGDLHATRNATSMAAHVAHLQAQGLIDDNMATELLKPYDKCKFSTEYLATHPDYTGVQPDMSTFVTADRHRAKRDKEMEQFIKDFKAGRIDEWGNPIKQEVYTKAVESGVVQLDPESVTNTIDDNESKSKSSQIDPSKIEAALGLLALSTPADSAQIQAALGLLALSAPTAPSPEPSTTVSTPILDPASMTSSAQPKPRKRKPKVAVKPLVPGPGALDYSEFKYGELVAECRRRKIMGGGTTQAVRNHLIQDDINVKQGLPRKMMRYQGQVRKVYKHEAPAALQTSQKDEA